MPKHRKPITAGGYIEAGRVQFDNRRLFDAALKAWNGTRVVVAIAPEVQSRSHRANAYLWGVVYKLMAEESGYSAEDLHELMKLRHNSKVVADPKTGEEVRIACSTASLSIEDFGIFIERVMVDGAEWLGISFPEPRRHEEWRDGTVVA